MKGWIFGCHRHSLNSSGLFNGLTDYHSHLLPGVDDGVQHLDESLEALAELESWGVRIIWLTPHIMEDMPNTTAHLRERFRELQAAYSGGITLHLASENMLDNLFNERLAQNDLLPIGTDGRHLLVETSYFNPPMDLNGTLEQIRRKGYYPVLAHPERYAYMDADNYRQLKFQGVAFQLNLPSLAGMYGKEVQRCAERMLADKMYNLIGTDIHALKPFQRVARLANCKADSLQQAIALSHETQRQL